MLTKGGLTRETNWPKNSQWKKISIEKDLHLCTAFFGKHGVGGTNKHFYFWRTKHFQTKYIKQTYMNKIN